jgi:tetratricopeptide (TPR) repeat protein
MKNKSIESKPCKSVTLTVHSTKIAQLKEKGADFSSSLSGKFLYLQDRILYQGIIIAVTQLEPDGPAAVTPATNVQIRPTDDHILLVCKSCGNTLEDIVETCGNCGAAISIVNLDRKIEAEKIQPGPQRPVTIEKKSNRNLFIAVGAVIVILILAAVIFLFNQPKSSSPTAGIEPKADGHSSWYNKGNELYKLGRHEEALEYYNKAISKSLGTHINVMVKYKDKIFNEFGFAAADPEFFKKFNIHVVQGRLPMAHETDPYIVMTMEMAKKYFGDDVPPLGEILNINNKRNFRIIGVVHIPGKVDIRADFFITTKGYRAIGGNI